MRGHDAADGEFVGFVAEDGNTGTDLILRFCGPDRVPRVCGERKRSFFFFFLGRAAKSRWGTSRPRGAVEFFVPISRESHSPPEPRDTSGGT